MGVAKKGAIVFGIINLKVKTQGNSPAQPGRMAVIV